MKTIRFVGLMVLLTLLIVPLGFTGKAHQLSRSAASEDDNDESSIYGNIKIRGTPSGHITVAVDKAFPMRRIQADGVPDAAFHFAPRKSKSFYQNLAMELEGAVVAFTGRRVTVLSAERYVLLNLTIEKAPHANQRAYYADATRYLSETVRVNGGRALVRHITSERHCDLCKSDAVISIPMRGKVCSLNVSVAVGVVCLRPSGSAARGIEGVRYNSTPA